MAKKSVLMKLIEVIRPRRVIAGNPYHKGSGPGGGQFTSGGSGGPQWDAAGTSIANPVSDTGIGRFYSRDHPSVGKQGVIKTKYSSPSNGMKVEVVGYNDKTPTYPYLVRVSGKTDHGSLLTVSKGQLILNKTK